MLVASHLSALRDLLFNALALIPKSRQNETKLSPILHVALPVYLGKTRSKRRSRQTKWIHFVAYNRVSRCVDKMQTPCGQRLTNTPLRRTKTKVKKPREKNHFVVRIGLATKQNGAGDFTPPCTPRAALPGQPIHSTPGRTTLSWRIPPNARVRSCRATR
jgi:hypothetical protein